MVSILDILDKMYQVWYRYIELRIVDYALYTYQFGPEIPRIFF